MEDGAELIMCAGYLYKSPPENQFKTMKSWKRRYFALLKSSDHTCKLKYYKNAEKSKPLGDIDLSKVTYMLLHPEMHAMWKWIQNNFRCSLSCVMFMKVPERDYFLIGENSWEMDKWFTAIFDVLHNRPHRLLDPKEFGTTRTINEPSQSTSDNNQEAEWGLTKHITQTLPMSLSVIHEPVYTSPIPVYYKRNQTELIADKEHEEDSTDCINTDELSE